MTDKLSIDEETLAAQREWSLKTFGPGLRTKGITNHIRKELDEVEADPEDLEEWVDIAILALDGAWRSGHSAEEVIAMYRQKLEKNRKREWPSFENFTEDEPIEHLR